MKTEQLTAKEHSKIAFQTALAKSIISSQFALHNNEILKHTQYYKADIKKYGKPFILALIRAEVKEFDKVDDVDSKRVAEIFESLDKILQTLSRAIFIDWEELDMIVKAYAKDPESMKGIAKKIMKKNTL
jgi:DNA integrity scanning protein DisA with diadenylate cyclase activity